MYMYYIYIYHIYTYTTYVYIYIYILVVRALRDDKKNRPEAMQKRASSRVLASASGLGHGCGSQELRGPKDKGKQMSPPQLRV